jgi:guanylate kinase
MDPIPRLPAPAFPVVVSGPSGVGKTVLCRRLFDALPWTTPSISATTRPPRPGERDGQSYFFYDRKRFEAERTAGHLAEWAEVHGNLYGTPRDWLDQKLREGLSVVLNIDVQGGLSLRRLYPESLLVFVLPPSMTMLEKRLRERGTDSEEEICHRLRTAERELLCLPLYDSVVVNEGLEEAAVDLTAIVRGERARVARRLPKGERRHA